MPRTIVYINADTFYASVEQADVVLRGKPVADGGQKLDLSFRPYIIRLTSLAGTSN